MNSTDSYANDSSDAATPIGQPPDITEGRRELARLIGRLLAHEWLHKQRTGKQRHSGGNDADDSDDGVRLAKL